MLSEKEEKEKLESEAKAKADAEIAEKAKWDEQQQRADQEAANAKKAREELSNTRSVLETAQSENESLKEQLEQAEAKAARAGIKDVELEESEYEGTDLNLVRAIKALNQKVDAKDKEISELNKKAAGYEKRDRENQVQAARDTAYEELLGGLDTEYGADCRNEAVKMFNEMIAKGDVPKGNPIKATRAMEKCYKEVKSAKSKDSKDKKKSSLPLDTGSGGGSSPSLSGAKIPSGLSLDDATEHLAAAANM